MSPTIAMSRPSIFPFFSLIVKASRRAWVGCSFVPSPAFITDALSFLARRCGTPAEECLIIIKSAPRAWTVRAVSIRLSPLTTLLVGTEKLMTSVLSLFAASSKDVLVLVEGSKKRLTAVLPRRVGTFFISLPSTSLNPAAVSSMRFISSTDNSLMPSRSFLFNNLTPN